MTDQHPTDWLVDAAEEAEQERDREVLRATSGGPDEHPACREPPRTSILADRMHGGAGTNSTGFARWHSPCPPKDAETVVPKGETITLDEYRQQMAAGEAAP